MTVQQIDDVKNTTISIDNPSEAENLIIDIEHMDIKLGKTHKAEGSIKWTYVDGTNETIILRGSGDVQFWTSKKASNEFRSNLGGTNWPGENMEGYCSTRSTLVPNKDCMYVIPHVYRLENQTTGVDYTDQLVGRNVLKKNYSFIRHASEHKNPWTFKTLSGGVQSVEISNKNEEFGGFTGIKLTWTDDASALDANSFSIEEREETTNPNTNPNQDTPSFSLTVMLTIAVLTILLIFS